MVKTCNYEGCTYNSLKGGVCFRHGASLKKYICAAMKDAPIWQGRGEFVSGTVQHRQKRLATMKDAAPIKQGKVEFVSDMVQRGSNANMKDVPIRQRGEEFVPNTE